MGVGAAGGSSAEQRVAPRATGSATPPPSAGAMPCNASDAATSSSSNVKPPRFTDTRRVDLADGGPPPGVVRERDSDTGAPRRLLDGVGGGNGVDCAGVARAAGSAAVGVTARWRPECGGAVAAAACGAGLPSSESCRGRRGDACTAG